MAAKTKDISSLDVPFISEVYGFVEVKLSYHLHSDRNFRDSVLVKWLTTANKPI